MWRRLVQPFREFGAWSGTLYVVDRLLSSMSPHLGLYVYDMMVQPITVRPLLPQRLAKNLSLREIVPGDAEVATMPAREDIKRERFAQGAQCLGVYRKLQLIGYLWFCRRQYNEDEVRCTYELGSPENSVFDFDFYILPEHRMGVAFTGVWHMANAYLHERGVRFTFSRLTRFNSASRRAHDRLGWRGVARLIVLKLWRLELMVLDQWPYAALTCSREHRVRIRLKPDVLDQPA